MSLGNPNAKVTVAEYASLGCPICAKWNSDNFAAFKAKYVDTGRVHYVLKEMLTGDAPISAAGFLLARCAGKDKYFQVVDAVCAPGRRTCWSRPRRRRARPAAQGRPIGRHDRGRSSTPASATTPRSRASTSGSTTAPTPRQDRLDADLRHQRQCRMPPGDLDMAALDKAITAAEAAPEVRPPRPSLQRFDALGVALGARVRLRARRPARRAPFRPASRATWRWATRRRRSR